MLCGYLLGISSSLFRPRTRFPYICLTTLLLNVSDIVKDLAAHDMDLDLPVYGDDLPEAEATSSVTDARSSGHGDIIEFTSSVAAPMRRKKRMVRALPRDTRLELRNSEILSWNTNYLNNMKEAARLKIKYRIQQQAKKNAEHYVWGSGIGGLGRDVFTARGPLNRFIGDDLFELFTGISKKPKTTTKRDRDSGIDKVTQEEALRKRQKIGQPEEEIGRGQDDEGLFILGGDEEVELPREAVSALDDQQIFSAMPWNISASKRGSSAVPFSGRITMMSEQGRQGSRAGIRMVSASPLLRRSTGRLDEFEALQSLDSDALGGDEFAFAAPTSDAAEPENPARQPSLRVREALSAEGENFFAFVADAIMEKRGHVQADPEVMPGSQSDAAPDTDGITFEELLPHHETNRLVACQGFLMLLSLGTKGMLDVQQPTAFAWITLTLTEKARAMHLAEDKDGENVFQKAGADEEDRHSTHDFGDNEQLSEPDDSHFQEQMAAGHAAADHMNDHDSLYDSH